MAEVFVTLVSFGFVFFWMVIVTSIISKSVKTAKRGPGTVSSDGHIVKSEQDLTCEDEYGHVHNNDKNIPRYIVHEDENLDDRFVTLNGVKRSYRELKNM